MKDERFLELVRTHVKGMDRSRRLAYLVRFFWHSAYEWGHEIITGTDCSGMVCGALLMMGYNVRTTAQGLKDFLTEGTWITHPRCGDLAFYSVVGTGKVVHVAVVSDNWVLMSAEAPNTLDVPFEMAVRERMEKGQEIEFRRVNWEAVKVIGEHSEHSWGVDDKAVELMGVFNV